MARVRKDPNVVVAIAPNSDILPFIGLTSSTGVPIHGIRMRGICRARLGVNWKVFLQSTLFPKMFSRLLVVCLFARYCVYACACFFANY